jgi:glucose-1-phosphate adenylyltransferase
MAVDSTVSGGVIVSGSEVKRSLLFSKVRVNSFCEVNGAVILPEATIGRHCKISNAIIDRGCKIPDNLNIGIDHDADRANGFRVTEKGIVLVTQAMITAMNND